MSFDLAPARALAERYRLARPVLPPRGPAGEIYGRGAGSSVEFQDFRSYVPGDDPRHIDWAALARTDQLIVRLHRAEVALSVDLLLDASRSLASKAERAAQLACLLALAGRRAGARVTLWTLGDEAEPTREGIEERLRTLAFEGRRPLDVLLDRAPPRLRPGSIRLLVSDFLFPHDPGRLGARLAPGAGGGAWVRLLAAEEEEPPAWGHVRLRDVETGEEREVAVTEREAALYRQRLRRLEEGAEAACRAARIPFARARADRPLEELCRGPLLEAGLLEPA